MKQECCPTQPPATRPGRHREREHTPVALAGAARRGAAGPPLIPGPTLHAEAGDVLVVHFGNAAVKLEQALTLHPHGVRYRRTLRKPGLYRIVCTLHEEMTMTIRLRRPG